MTNSIAFGIVAGIALLVGLDIWYDAGITLFLGRKFVDAILYLAFWR